MPSTIFNIFDLLSNYKQVVASNPNISYGYIVYQWSLMLGTALGPGSIFLMLIGALQSAFKLGFRDAFLFNSFPIVVFMLACQFAKKRRTITNSAALDCVLCVGNVGRLCWHFPSNCGRRHVLSNWIWIAYIYWIFCSKCWIASPR